MRIEIRDGAICITPEDDDEREIVEITINTLLGWSAGHDREKRQQ